MKEEYECLTCKKFYSMSTCTRCEFEPKVKTNADRIRSMSDEELAEELSNISFSTPSVASEYYDWLKQEVE